VPPRDSLRSQHIIQFITDPITSKANVPVGRVESFTMNAADSK